METKICPFLYPNVDGSPHWCMGEKCGMWVQYRDGGGRCAIQILGAAEATKHNV